MLQYKVNTVNRIHLTDDTGIALIGKNSGSLRLTERDLSLHMALLGGSGYGKTHAMKQMVQAIREQMTSDDAMLIFDVKGDYLKDFGGPNDIVLCNDSRCSSCWNLLLDAAADGEDCEEANAREIASSLFAGAIRNSSSPYFPKAAADVFQALIRIQASELRLGAERSNQTLYQACTSGKEILRQTLDSWPECAATCCHIESDNDQTAGVVSELSLTASEVLTGKFRQNGDLSVRKHLRNPGKRTIFIEYDIGIGRTLTPLYSLLFDMAIKETLRGTARGKVFLIMDEFRLLPGVSHLEDGVSLGRELGLRMLVATQNIGQLRHSYGKDLADSMIASFGTKVVFNNEDAETREFLTKGFGVNLHAVEYQGSRQQGLQHTLMEERIVSDRDLRQLGIGEVIVKTPGNEPRKFAFQPFRPNGGPRT